MSLNFCKTPDLQETGISEQHEHLTTMGLSEMFIF